MFRIVKYLGYILFLPIWWIQIFFPRNKKIWVFGAWYGKRFSDNSKYLYLYILKNHPEIKVIWLTRDMAVYDKAKIYTPKNVFMTNSIRGIYYSLQAKNIIVSSGKRDVNYLFTNGANCIQLWHGNPMKKIGMDDKFSNVNSFFQQVIVPKLFPFVCEFNYDYVVSNSSAFTDKMSTAFNISTNKVLETGCPRNDAFYNPIKDTFNEELRAKFKDCKLVYYLPTFRNHFEAKSIFTLTDYNPIELQSFLIKHNIVLVSKGHFVDNKLDLEKNNPHSRIIHLSDNQTDDINFMLKDADLLITDYSGAYFDFLLALKPIIFAAFDLKEYLKGSREMYFNYNDVVAGPIVQNWEELMNALKTIWTDTDYKDLIIEKNNIFNKYHDSNNSKRAFEKIKTLT
ncbi:hypothetical protein DHD05_01415 [Arenibacter sp. N53]|uniref:CDP-glycerol glycerophosphotransferase family protein n=1 Tax=Arenibacter TaxID=178469 RepID=UPI000CD3DBEF|nr:MULTISPECIES: CDP-glycerol glycerophosphotransferase family protein [Arenibacter]MCM4150235.1 hypothetical protein [Arenibacter sp. N53]